MADKEHDKQAAENLIPRHIAIVMDGNGRWASQRGLKRIEGHYSGMLAARRVAEAADDRGVDVVSLYAFSSENWTRPSEEVQGLLELMQHALVSELKRFHARGVQFRASGRLDQLPAGLRAVLDENTRITADNDGMVLNLCINYGGRAEIVDATKAIAAKALAGELALDDIDEDIMQANLYHPDLPAPDLVIRPGGELRISNFLLWEIAYAEFYVTQTYWPDFDEEHLDAAIAAFNLRQRRFGGVESNS